MKKPRSPRRSRSARPWVRAAALWAFLPLIPLLAACEPYDPCEDPNAVIVCENSKPGTAPSEWEVIGTGDDSIQGFATSMSVDAGSTIGFKVDTLASSYDIEIYRMGYYQGNGARRVADLTPSASLPQIQPPCLDDPTTGLLDCGNWGLSATWDVPADAVSGIYFAHLVRTDPGNVGTDNHIVFVVKDARAAEVRFQTSDTTWQAYNSYGGTSLYGGPAGKASKVSYNRPFSTRGPLDGRDFVWNAEYPMVRYLESNGFDVTYQAGIDTSNDAASLLTAETFLSVGHDEYWSGPQRDNVEAARDAGVDLSFFSGNSVYWKIRWEPSIDGTATADRTMVTYKETQADAKIDPSPEWTGTWRDPRFSPPYDGGRPENELMGTMFGAQCCTTDLEISGDYADLRFWRETAVADLAPGESLTLAPGSLGYEWDEEPDNGFRPAGLFRVSTTVVPTAQRLVDFGSTVADGPSEHAMTLYRAPSGALVFGAGTIQWAWGLDGEHDGDPSTTDHSMRQATMNLLLDQGALPRTPDDDLTLTIPSQDVTGPTVAITSPAPGASLANGATVAVSGTASDAEGTVGAVEVSTDGGATWHRAEGRASWSYDWVVEGNGPTTILARASDDSGNLSTTPASRSVEVACPCTLFGDDAVPTTPSVNDTSSVELGVRVTPEVDGYITGVRFYKGALNTGTHTGSFWAPDGTRLATATFTGETATGWQEVAFPEAVQVTAGTTYVASYRAPNGGYAADPWYFTTKGEDQAPLLAPQSTAAAGNGVYELGTVAPANSFNATNYWVDVTFDTTEPPDVLPPQLVTRTPLPGQSSVAWDAPVTVDFNEAVVLASVDLVLEDEGGTPVPGSLSYDAANRRVTLTPAAPLAEATTYRATLSSAADPAGNVLSTPVTWTFTTALPGQEPGVCPCTLYDDADTPQLPSVPDPAAVELGVRFTADADGWIDGIRFYKGIGNGGTHVGTLWTSGGTPLAQVTFVNESTSGWQTAWFSSPVPVDKDVVYVASYLAPQGRYAATIGAFGAVGIDRPPLHALAANGVYQYGGGFPNTTSDHDYAVDVMYRPAPDVEAPVVELRSPGPDATNVSRNRVVQVRFDEPLAAPTTGVVQVRPVGGSPLAGTSTYDATTSTITFTPSAPLTDATTYEVTVSGAVDTNGNAMPTPDTWSFTTGGLGLCPCGLFASDEAPTLASTDEALPIELGVRFTSSSDGWVTGVRFYKGTLNTGTHTGSLWAPDGTRLATATFTGETATGWQEVSFATPVPVTAGVEYTASYFAPNGGFAVDRNAFGPAGLANGPLLAAGSGRNGVFAYGASPFPTASFRDSNYWVDVIFTDVDPSGP